MNHYLAYDNILADGTLVVSSQATGFEGSNAAKWTTYNYWKPAAIGTSYITATFTAAQKADYFAVYAHNLDTTVSAIRLEYSTDGGTTWVPNTPWLSSEGVIFHRMSQQSAAKWRVALSCPTAVASVGVIAFGSIVEIPNGVPDSMVTPDRTFGNEFISSIGDSGRLLGNTLLRNASDFTIQALLQDPEWITDEWVPFIDHAESNAFFYAWDDDYKAAYCWANGQASDVKYTGGIWNDASLKVKAQRWV